LKPFTDAATVKSVKKPRKNKHAIVFAQKYGRLIKDSPSPALAEANLSRLVECGETAALDRIPRTELTALFNVLGSSTYLSDILFRQESTWPELFLRQVHTRSKSIETHCRELEGAIRNAESIDQFCAALRRHKQREYLRIGARDLLAEVSLDETVRELSGLADASLEASYRYCRAAVESEYGYLTLPGNGKRNRFVILGMGKLGGGELNFSSDIDVVYLYEGDDGESAGGPKGNADPRRFFSEVGKKIIHCMGEVTEDGFVFRTDLRLRPLGVSGPLVQSVNSAMVYYESWGQCWERAALIKARAVAGDKDLGTEFLEEVRPFIYRRYLDYTTVDELRHMKLRIENELLTAADKERNVKLGYGGIREIEFFTQALQLVNGGYVPEVRGASTLAALDALARHKFISVRERDLLTEAYRFQRQVEHKVQIVQEAHAHSIPQGKDEEQALARRLGYRAGVRLSERQRFWRDYHTSTKKVRAIFDRLFYRAQKEIVDEGASDAGAVWHDLDREEVIVNGLRALGFIDPQRAYTNLLAVRDGEAYSPPSPKRRQVMRTLGPALIAEIAASSAPDQALSNLSKFSHSIGGRTGFLTLLAENPKTMRLLVTLFADSQFLTDLFLQRPELIDTLIRGDLSRVEKSKQVMLAELTAILAQAGDVEAKLNALRRYKTEEFIRIGLHDLGGAIELVRVLRQLSDLADACLEGALALTLEEFEEQFGAVPQGRFAIMGGGKLGGRELDYNSDLDLVFVYQAEDQSLGGSRGRMPAHEFYVRLGQKLLTYLSAPTEEGIAYKIDMQLRPSGKAGPIVCSLDAYREYHRSASELWERQALIKTRFVAGFPLLGREIEHIAESFAYRTGLPPEGVREINHLRMRMERELAGEDATRFNLKKGRGGLVDIEFLTQMLQLAHGHRVRALRQRGTLEAMKKLADARILKRAEYKLFAEGYLFLRRLDHRLRLERDQSIDAFEADAARLDGIARALGYQGGRSSRSLTPGQRLLRDYALRREQVRAGYERYFLTGQQSAEQAVN
jgi:[glutamine synthetase] adenylyltransferase / [glutamine synthetase]-adenylyl-L-tyrosine phosphorylase